VILRDSVYFVEVDALDCLPYILGAMIFFAVYVLIGWLIARNFQFADHHRFELTETPQDRGLSAEQFRFTPERFSPDSTRRLCGWIIRPAAPLTEPNACVLMIHGYDSGKDKVWTFPDDPTYRASMLDQGAESLARAGFHVAAIDLRSHGESDDFGMITLGHAESHDVLDTLDYLVANASHYGIDPSRIGVRGESMGGATAIIAAANDDQQRIRSLWIDSVYADARRGVSDFIQYHGVPRVFAPIARFFLEHMTRVPVDRSSPIQYVASIRCPSLLVHSSDDTMIPIRHFEQLHAAATWHTRPEFWKVHTHEHNRLWREPDYHVRQISFFTATLTPASS
jgi:dipeptidyl aminopeptidase/acylaminoacyl peptidase